MISQQIAAQAQALGMDPQTYMQQGMHCSDLLLLQSLSLWLPDQNPSCIHRHAALLCYVGPTVTHMPVLRTYKRHT